PRDLADTLRMMPSERLTPTNRRALVVGAAMVAIGREESRPWPLPPKQIPPRQVPPEQLTSGPHLPGLPPPADMWLPSGPLTPTPLPAPASLRLSATPRRHSTPHHRWPAARDRRWRRRRRRT